MACFLCFFILVDVVLVLDGRCFLPCFLNVTWGLLCGFVLLCVDFKLHCNCNCNWKASIVAVQHPQHLMHNFLHFLIIIHTSIQLNQILRWILHALDKLRQLIRCSLPHRKEKTSLRSRHALPRTIPQQPPEQCLQHLAKYVPLVSE